LSELEERIQIFEENVLPRWARHFGEPLLQGLSFPEGASALDVACGMGHPSLELLEKYGESIERVMAIDRSREVVEAAAIRAGELSGKKLFCKRDNLERLGFPDRSFDLVIGAFGLMDFEDNRRMLRELVRVARPGARLALSFASRNSLRELFDLFVAELRRRNADQAARALEKVGEGLLSTKETEYMLEKAGLADVSSRVERFNLEYQSGDEFKTCPVFEEYLRPAMVRAVEDRKLFGEVTESVEERIARLSRQSAFSVGVVAAFVTGERVA